MSLLEALAAKRTNLRPTTTTVTQADGRKYVQTSNSVVLIEDKSPGFVVDTKPDDRPALIIDNLYLGAQDCCLNLEPFGIRKVLSIGIDSPVKMPGVEYKFVELLDLPESNLRGVLEGTNAFLKDSLKCDKVLVHCNAGVSRSTSIIIGFLIVEKGFQYDEALKLIRQVRPCVRPNDGFARQLKAL